MSFLTLDIDWYCIDEFNNVGHFASAGGQVPKLVKEHFQKHQEVNAFLMKMEEMTTCKIANDATGDTNTFAAHAKRGLYSYDKKTPCVYYSDNLYQIVAIPRIALKCSDLPNSLIEVISQIRLPYNFDKMATLDLTNFVEP